jgi:hypothetical protein
MSMVSSIPELHMGDVVGEEAPEIPMEKTT